jgi:hypothetical protein
MKKLLSTGVFLVLYVSQLFSQNIGIGTNNPSRARLVVNGAVGNTAAMFGGETTGISLQSNFPTIGFNQYYNNGHRYMAGGHAAHQFFDPILGYMAWDIFPIGNTNGTATGSKRILALTANDMIVGTGLSRLSINKNPSMDGARNAALQIQQSVESNNAGISLSDVYNLSTWKISSLNIDEGRLTLNYNSYGAGYFAHTGSYYTYSDQRLKNDIRQLSPVLTNLMRLEPVQYKMKYNNDANNSSMGFIAQEVKKIFPQLVQVMPGSATGYTAYDDIHAVNYAGFGVLAIKAIQEQQLIIENLQQRISVLENNIKTSADPVVKN